MLKILYLDHAPILGGAEKALLDLIRFLDREEYQPVVATATDSALLPPLAAEGIRAMTMPFEQVNMRHPAFLLRLIRSTLGLVLIIRREKPDILHTNTVRAHVVSSLASRLTRVPLIWTIHDRTLPAPLFRLLGRVPRRVIFVSQTLSDLYVPGNADPSYPSRFLVIPNGVRPATLEDGETARRKLGLTRNHTVIVNAGRLVDGKGQDVFLRAAAFFAQNRPDVVFLIVGGPNEGDPASARYAERLRELANSLGLGGTVIFAGHQMNIAAYYQAADLCAYTAVLPEGSPLVILEAMAHGKAVVASNLMGVPELVLDGITGKLVQPGNPRDLAEAINNILDDREALKELGDSGRQRVIEHFDPDRSFTRVRSLYDEVLAQGRGGRTSAFQSPPAVTS